MYKIFSIALIPAVMMSSCAEKTGMPEFSVFNMSVRNETVQVPSEGMIDDVSIVKLDNSAGAPVIGIIEDAYESENAYYIVSSETVYEYAKDGSFIASYSQSALKNSGIYLSSFFFSGGDMILYASSNSPVQDMLRWDAVTDGLTAVSERSREMLPGRRVSLTSASTTPAPANIPRMWKSLSGPEDTASTG